jgi:hypothetical protein
MHALIICVVNHFLSFASVFTMNPSASDLSSRLHFSHESLQRKYKIIKHCYCYCPYIHFSIIMSNDLRTIICNDATGLCLSGQTASDTGVFTNLTRLASQLEGNTSSSAPPLITIETDSYAWLVKEYEGGQAVAMQVPVGSTASPAPMNGASSEVSSSS